MELGVDQNVAKRNDLAIVLDPLRHVWIVPRELRERLTHDLALAFHGGTKQFITLVTSEILVVAESCDARHRLPNIE